jgi:microcompartment protein CcmL/EutN
LAGPTAAVESAVKAGAEIAKGCLIDKFFIPNVHQDVITSIGRTQLPEQIDGALGYLSLSMWQHVIGC